MKALSYEKWIQFAMDNYKMVSDNYDSVVYEATIFDYEMQEERDVSHTLSEVISMCMNTSMERAMRNCIMKAVYTGYGLESNIQKVMNEYYVIE